MKAVTIVSVLTMAVITTAGKPGNLITAPEQVAVDTTIIEVYASDEGLAFDPNEVRAKAGSIVKIRFVNPTMLPHNIVILKSAKDLDAIGEASFAAAATGFVPMQHKSKNGWIQSAGARGKNRRVYVHGAASGRLPFRLLRRRALQRNDRQAAVTAVESAEIYFTAESQSTLRKEFCFTAAAVPVLRQLVRPASRQLRNHAYRRTSCRRR